MSINPLDENEAPGTKYKKLIPGSMFIKTMNKAQRSSLFENF